MKEKKGFWGEKRSFRKSALKRVNIVMEKGTRDIWKKRNASFKRGYRASRLITDARRNIGVKLEGEIRKGDHYLLKGKRIKKLREEKALVSEKKRMEGVFSTSAWRGGEIY